ncbi:MAG: hypothetical protein IPK07_24340 [Deltaproteobacteria bacterium]|nr:hypothetical protein [Deltaproteobacteria bacterium]
MLVRGAGFALLALALVGAACCDTTILVDSLLDENGSTPANGTCTLREALIAANTNAAVDTCIAGQAGADVISLPAGTVALTLAGTTDDTGDLDLLQDVSLVGAGVDVTIVEASSIADRVIDVAGGVTASLIDLTVRGGSQIGGVGVLVTGGGVQNAGTLTLTRAAVRDNALHTGEATFFSATGNHAEGGGIWSSGTLALFGSEVTGNLAEGGPGGVTCLSLSCYTFPGGQGRGGGVFASGAVTITDSSVAGNTARGGAGRNASPAAFPGYYLQSGGGGAVGGGVRATATAALAIERSTLAGNVAVGGVGGAGLPVPNYVPGAVGGASTGGALVTDVAATITNSTVTENGAAGGAGGEPSGAVGAASGGALVANAGVALAHATVSANAGGAEVAVGVGSSSIANSVLAASCSGLAGASLGGNVESPGDTCGLTEGDDRVNVSGAALELAGLASNGGPTQTQAIPSASAAAGAGRAANCLPIDQRGVARPASACDSGAFEASE